MRQLGAIFVLAGVEQGAFDGGIELEAVCTLLGGGPRVVVSGARFQVSTV